MRIGQSINAALKVAMLCALIYGVVKWQSGKPGADDDAEVAEKACIGAIGARFNTNSVRSYAVNKNNNGYVIRASISLASGAPAKVYCLASDQGSVRDIGIQEQ